MTIREVAAELNLSINRVRVLILANRLPATFSRERRRWEIAPEAVDKVRVRNEKRGPKARA